MFLFANTEKNVCYGNHENMKFTILQKKCFLIRKCHIAMNEECLPRLSTNRPYREIANVILCTLGSFQEHSDSSKPR